MKNKHRISDAYGAYWFIYYHPKFMLRERNEVTPKEANKLEAEGFIITRDVGGKCYREWRHVYRHAIDSNLDIHYAKTDKPGGRGRVNDDPKKNKYTECWLEFGTEFYAYVYSGTSKSIYADEETMRHGSHDPNLDSGGSTFDQALVMLARKIKKFYGDYADSTGREGKCSEPCADCLHLL